MTNQARRNIITSIRGKQTPGGRHQIGTPAGFKSESVAGFLLECVAGFIGIRMLAARMLGRAWLGIELDGGYCDIATRRLAGESQASLSRSFHF